MWIPTRTEAVGMYARFCIAHDGVNAAGKAKSKAHELARKGDFEGQKIWGEVVREIEKEPVRTGPLSWVPGVQ